MNKKRGLGRGLDALLGVVTSPPGPARPADESLRQVPIDLIERGRYQPRADMHPESLQELADSIRAQGIVQPIVLRPLAHGGRYEIIAGERRWRAAQLAGLHEIPALIKDVADHAAMSIALIENIQREQLNAIEQAQGFARLINEFGMTHQSVAEAVGRSRVAVTNLLRLLELAPEVRAMVERGVLEMGHARALVALETAQQIAAAREVAERGLSVRQTEALVKRLKALKSAAKSSPKRPDPNIEALARDLSERLGAAVAIHHSPRGSGELTIRYHSLDELDGILSRIR